MAFYMIGAGILTGLLAAIFGLVDWIAIPANTRAQTVGAVHGAGNVIIVLLFAGSFYLGVDNNANLNAPNSHVTFDTASSGSMRPHPIIDGAKKSCDDLVEDRIDGSHLRLRV